MQTDELMDPTTRLITFDWCEELGKKMGFIRSIPNITKIPQPIFDQIMSDPAFHFEIKKAIPMTEWEWDGGVIVPENIVDRKIAPTINVFRLQTYIEGTHISTVGSLWCPRMQEMMMQNEAGVNHNDLNPPENDHSTNPYNQSRVRQSIEELQRRRSSSANPYIEYSFRNHMDQGITHLWHYPFGSEYPPGIYFDYETMALDKSKHFKKDDTLQQVRTLDEKEATAWHYIFCAYYSVMEKE